MAKFSTMDCKQFPLKFISCDALLSNSIALERFYGGNMQKWISSFVWALLSLSAIYVHIEWKVYHILVGHFYSTYKTQNYIHTTKPLLCSEKKPSNPAANIIYRRVTRKATNRVIIIKRITAITVDANRMRNKLWRKLEMEDLQCSSICD